MCQEPAHKTEWAERQINSKEECVFEETEGLQHTQMGRWRVDESALEGWQMPWLTPSVALHSSAGYDTKTKGRPKQYIHLPMPQGQRSDYLSSNFVALFSLKMFLGFIRIEAKAISGWWFAEKHMTEWDRWKKRCFLLMGRLTESF